MLVIVALGDWCADWSRSFSHRDKAEGAIVVVPAFASDMTSGKGLACTKTDLNVKETHL